MFGAITTGLSAICGNASASTGRCWRASPEIRWRVINVLSVWSVCATCGGQWMNSGRPCKILPNHVGYRANLAIFMNYAGDSAGAEQEVRAMKDPPPNAMIALAFSQTLQGQLGEAAETYAKLSAPGAPRATFATAALGDLAVYEGRFTDAVRTFEQGAAADLAAKNSDTAANKFASLAYANLVRGRKDAAVTAAEKVLASSKVIQYRFLAARVLVEAGALAPAEALAADLASQLAAEPQAYGKILQGLIALKKRDVPQAIKILTDANNVVDTWLGHFDLGRAYLEGGAFTQADSEFDLCIKRRGETLSLLNEDPTYGQFPPGVLLPGSREGRVANRRVCCLIPGVPEDSRQLERGSATSGSPQARRQLNKTFIMSVPPRDYQSAGRQSVRRRGALHGQWIGHAQQRRARGHARERPSANRWLVC